MPPSISKNMKTLSVSESDFFVKMKTANIPAVDLIDLYANGKIEEVLYRKDEYDFALTTLNCSRKNNLAVTGNEI